jgi:hypothetical protein
MFFKASIFFRSISTILGRGFMLPGTFVDFDFFGGICIDRGFGSKNMSWQS